MRNCSAMVVLPVPGLPSSRCRRLRAKPPPSTPSRPKTPVEAHGKNCVVASIFQSRRLIGCSEESALYGARCSNLGTKRGFRQKVPSWADQCKLTWRSSAIRRSPVAPTALTLRPRAVANILSNRHDPNGPTPPSSPWCAPITASRSLEHRHAFSGAMGFFCQEKGTDPWPRQCSRE
jgi:hypothetical protein